MAQGYTDFARNETTYAILTEPGLLSGGGTSVTHDSIDITKMTKGPIVQTHTAQTTPVASTIQSAVGYNAIQIALSVTAFTSGTSYLAVSGNMDGGATLGAVNDSRATPMQISRTATGILIQTFVGIPDNFFLNVFGTFVATYSAYYQLLNV